MKIKIAGDVDVEKYILRGVVVPATNKENAMKMKIEQAARITTFAKDIGAKYNLYAPLVEDILYDYMREAMPKKLRQTLDESIMVDSYLDQLDIYIEKAENRLLKDITKYLTLKNLEVKPEGLITPEEFALQMKEIANTAEHDDEEKAHGKGDQLMTDTLTALGYKEGCDIFDDMPKWYA